MTRDLTDTAGYYQLSHSNGRLADGCRLRFDRGTLLLEGMNRLPPGLEEDFRHDPRVDAYRAPALPVHPARREVTASNRRDLPMKGLILISVVLLSACAGTPETTSSPGQYGFASTMGAAAQREKLIAEENGWRIWEITGERSGRLRIKVGSDQRVICIAVKTVPGSPWPAFSTDYRYVSGGKGFYMLIEDSETTPYFGFFGQHPYRWPANAKVSGHAIADSNDRDTVLAWEGQDVSFSITTQPSAESYKETYEDTGIVSFTGVRQAYRLMMACHERSQ